MNIVEILNKEIENPHSAIIVDILQDILKQVEKGVNETERIMIFSRKLLLYQCALCYINQSAYYISITELYKRVLDYIRNN